VAHHATRIIYLGKKGGGLSLLEDLLTNLNSESRSCELWLSSTLNPEELDLAGNYKVTYLFSPRNLMELLNPRVLFIGLINLKKVLFSKNVDLNIFLMPSPFDWIYYRLLRIKKQNIATCLHDLKSHSGERWPTLKSTLFRLRISDNVVVFSRYLASELRSSTTKEIFLASLPSNLRPAGPVGSDVNLLIQKIQSSKLPVVLLIGRQRKYKDVEAFQQLAQDFQETALFIIAGEGTIEESSKSKVVVMNRWLSNREFMQLIENSDILFFPYSEASQSGNIPLAMSEKKIIVATSQPGLTEQLRDYSLKVIYDGSKIGNITLALVKALAIHADAAKLDKKTIPDDTIRLPKVIEVIDFILKKGE
jgi:glycosyltransferase involved in cell wall biosynthesis